MFSFLKKKETREFQMPAGLSKQEQMQVKEIIKAAKHYDEIPRTAQQSIPFDRMFQDGICRVGMDYYTKTIQFQDINYQLALQEDKTEIFEEWCSFLNFFDSSIHFELSFMNMATDAVSFGKSIAIAHQKDGFNDIRDEYSEVLLKQMEAGNNGLTKTKFLTFGIRADSMKAAKPRLAHIEMDILNNFKRIGVQARTLNGYERLELMHKQFHMGDNDRFHFDWKYLVNSGLSVKDFIAPSSFAFPNGRMFQMGSLYGCMSFLSIDASDISDRMLADFLGMESSLVITMHIQSVDQNEAIKTVKHTITELDRSKIEEQKKAVRAGYDMDIIPSDAVFEGKKGNSDENHYEQAFHYCVDGNFQAMLDEYKFALGFTGADFVDAIKDSFLQTSNLPYVSQECYRSMLLDNENVKIPRLRVHFAAGYFDAKTSDKTIQRVNNVRNAFNSPFRPFVLATTSVGQEGLDFHLYSRKVVHWNLPCNPIDLEQREGRINRFLCHAIRQNVAANETDMDWMLFINPVSGIPMKILTRC